MQNSFSFSRLGKLINKQFHENSRLYLYSILAIIGLMSLIFTFWIGVAGGPYYNEMATYIIYLVGLFITGTIFASMTFNMLGSRDKGMYWLAVPATHLEKLVCQVLFTTVLFTIVYTVCFLLVKTIAISFLKEYVSSHPGTTYVAMEGFDEEFTKMIKYFMYAFFSFQTLYLLGSVYFRRYAFIITSAVTALIFFAFGFYISTLQDNLLDGAAWNMVTAIKWQEDIKDGYWLYSVSPGIQEALLYVIKFAWVPLFWTVTWFRLKEKEL
jgi:hypothetical protein